MLSIDESVTFEQFDSPLIYNWNYPVRVNIRDDRRELTTSIDSNNKRVNLWTGRFARTKQNLQHWRHKPGLTFRRLLFNSVNRFSIENPRWSTGSSTENDDRHIRFLINDSSESDELMMGRVSWRARPYELEHISSGSHLKRRRSSYKASEGIDRTIPRNVLFEVSSFLLFWPSIKSSATPLRLVLNKKSFQSLMKISTPCLLALPFLNSQMSRVSHHKINCASLYGAYRNQCLK